VRRNSSKKVNQIGHAENAVLVARLTAGAKLPVTRCSSIKR
jgi:hypothetical protein